MRLLLIAGFFAASSLTACGDSKAIAEKRNFISQGLRDPSSTQFRNESLKKSGWLCGEMNSKNAYGAYVGFKRFMAKDEVNSFVEGMSSTGVGKPDHQQILMALELENSALKQAKELVDSGSLDGNLAKVWMKRRVFEMQWQEYCQ